MFRKRAPAGIARKKYDLDIWLWLSVKVWGRTELFACALQTKYTMQIHLNVHKWRGNNTFIITYSSWQILRADVNMMLKLVHSLPSGFTRKSYLICINVYRIPNSGTHARRRARTRTLSQTYKIIALFSEWTRSRSLWIVYVSSLLLNLWIVMNLASFESIWCRNCFVRALIHH